MSTPESKKFRLINGIANSLVFSVIAVFLFIVLWPAAPLGVPGEWTWSRHLIPQSAGEALDRFLPPFVTGLFWLITLRWWSNRRRRSRLMERLSIPILFLFGFSWGLSVQQAAPSPHKELKQLWVNYDKSASGYFFEAVFQTRRTSEFLRTYEARMKEGDVLHFGTHPPGLILESRLARNLMRQVPELTPVVMATQSSDVVAAFREIEIRVAAARPLDDFELAALVLVTFITQLSLGLTPVAVYLLARLVFGSEVGWSAACLSATAPALAVFCPKSDVLYASTGTILLWLTLGAWLRPSLTGRILSAAFAGFWLWICLMLSLAHLPVVAACSAFAVFYVIRSSSQQKNSRFIAKQILLPILIQGTVFLIAVQIWNSLSDCNLWNVWPQNLRNHAGFYGTSVRTWIYWLPANLGELCLACGPLVLIAAGSTLRRLVLDRNSILVQQNESPNSTDVSAAPSFVMATVATWALLWLSGKNMGEAMRLWCFLTPWFAMAAAVSVPASVQERLAIGFRRARRTEPLIPLLLLQMLIATAVVASVNGFSF